MIGNLRFTIHAGGLLAAVSTTGVSKCWFNKLVEIIDGAKEFLYTGQ
jgi:hypothetical protein